MFCVAVSETDPLQVKRISCSSDVSEASRAITECSPSCSRRRTDSAADFLLGLLRFGSMCASPKEPG